MRQMIVIAFLQQLAVLSSAFMQLHGLLYLFLLYRKRNIDLLATHFARKRNLIVKCMELKLWRLRRKQRTRWVNDGRRDQGGETCSQAYHRKKIGRKIFE